MITRKYKPLCLFIVPSILGYTGDVINERQLAKAFSKHCKLRTYSLVPLLRIPALNKSHLALIRNKTKLRLLLPIVVFPYTLNILYTF